MASLLDLLSQFTQPYQTAGNDLAQGGAAVMNYLKSGATQKGSALDNALSTPSGDGSMGSLAAAAPSANVASAPQPTADQILAAGGPAQSAPAAAASTNPSQSGPALQQQNVDPGQVTPVNATAGFPSPSDYNADGSPAAPGGGAASAPNQPAGGLLGSLAGAASDAVSDPAKSKGLLSSLGDAVSGMGAQLKGMSPAASQGLIAAGMTMLGNNNGHNNLAQLVGMGGTQGLNAYQQVNTNRIMMAKNAMDVQHMQNQDLVAAQNSATEALKAQHPFITTSPGQNVVQPGVAGAPASVIASGGVKAEGSVDQIQSDGSTKTFKTDTAGNIIPGTGQVSKDPNVGPLDPDRLKVVNASSETATKDQQALVKTQGLIAQLGQTNVPQGLMAKGRDLWSQVTGDQTTGQTLRNLVQTQAYQNMLAQWKPQIGGRLTNTDVNILKNHMPNDTAGSAAWQQYLTSFGKLQADVADQSTRQAAFTAQNRGDQGTLHAPLTIGSITYPQGASYQQVTMGQGGTAAQQPGQNGQNGQNGGNAALLAEAQRRGLKQNANGQWVVSSQSQ